MLGLYVHIPFCSAICNYCNFNRGLFDAALKARYVDALVAGDLRAAACDRRSRRDARPTRSTSAAARRRCSSRPRSRASSPPAAQAFDVAADARGHARGESRNGRPRRGSPRFARAGVNRLSFGVQSFRDDELRRLSRLHGADRARAALAEARAAGFDNVSLDLMMWLPGQRVDEWLESVDAAIALGPEHLSLYLLEVYPNAPLKDEMARARWSQAPDDDAAAMYLTAMERLDAAGLRAVRDLERRAAGPAVAPQPEVLDRRRVARLRLRRPLDARRRPLEERVGDRGLHRRASGAASRAAVGRAASDRRRAARRRAVHGPAADGGHRSGRGRRALRRRRLGALRRRPRAVPRGRAACGGTATALWLTRAGDASCQRGDDGFRVAAEYAKVTALSRRRPRCFERRRAGAGGRPVGLRWDCRRRAVGDASARAGAGSRPRSRRRPRRPRACSRSDAGMVLNFIKADKTADFEAVMAKLKEALQKSEKPERKQQAASWKVFKSRRARRRRQRALRVHHRPVGEGRRLHGVDDSGRGVPAPKCRRSTSSTPSRTRQGQNFVNLTLVVDLGKCSCRIDSSADPAFRISGSVPRRRGALASSAHRFPA